MISFPYTSFRNKNFDRESDKMNNYELMVIFTPVLSDDEFKAEQKKYAKLVP